MTTIRSALDRVMRVVPGLVGPALIALSEGAWVAVVYLVLEGAAHGAQPLGLGLFVAAAALGVVIGIRTRADTDRVRVIVAGLVVLGIAGWLVADSTVSRLIALDPAGAIGAHPGGPLLALATLRGVIRGGALADVSVNDSLLGGPAYGVALAWILGGALAEPARSAFATEALAPTILFVAAGPAGTAISRVAELARLGGFSWTANRTWLALLAGAFLVLAGAAAIGAAGGLGAVRGSAPLLILGVLVVAAIREPAPRQRHGERRRTVLAWLVVFAVIGVIIALPLQPRNEQTAQPSPPVPAADDDPAQRQGGAFLLIAGGAITAVVVVYMLRRRWASARLARTELGDDRFVDVGFSGFSNLGRWRPVRRARSGPPVDAAGAYRAALEALATDPFTRRAPGETPILHARRLRGDGAGSLGLELLAADYQLVRFGGIDLTGSEERRAMKRWRLIREAAEHRALRAAVAKIATDERGGEGGEADRSDARDSATASREGRV